MINFHSPIVLFMFITTVHNWYYSNEGKIAFDYDCDFPLYDIIQVTGVAELCGGFCLANSQCTHFAWSFNNSYLKTITDPNIVPFYNPPYPVYGRCGFVVVSMTQSPDVKFQHLLFSCSLRTLYIRIDE